MRPPTRAELSQAEAALKRGLLTGLLIVGLIWAVALVMVMLIVARGMAS